MFGALIELAITTILGNMYYINFTKCFATILSINTLLIYAFFSLHTSEQLLPDSYYNRLVIRSPIKFNGKCFINHMHIGTQRGNKNLCLVCKLICKNYMHTITKLVVDKRYNVIVTVFSWQEQLVTALITRYILPPVQALGITIFFRLIKNLFNNQLKVAYIYNIIPIIQHQVRLLPLGIKPVVVAIDAGHGGQDPGALGSKGLREKNITLAIAHKLKVLLDADPMFKPVLTRDGDYFISVMGRSDVARKKGASLLVSIHADAAPDHRASGSSVWILSNRRANSEMANQLNQYNKKLELLIGMGGLLANRKVNHYLSQAVLDLQFGHSQRVGYGIAMMILVQLQSIGTLHKLRPGYASFGVLRSLDIPSILVEIGFISNPKEGRLLGSKIYQEKIANALYLGLSTYFLEHPP